MNDMLLKENEALIQRLARIPALRSFNESDLRRLLQLSRVQRYREGELVFEEGVMGRRVYYLVQGKVKIVKDRKELMILQRTGDVFGEIGAIEGGTRTASVVALDDSVCVELDISGLEERAGEDQFMFRYMVFRGFSEILAHRLRVTTEELMALKDEVATLRGENRNQSA